MLSIRACRPTVVKGHGTPESITSDEVVVDSGASERVVSDFTLFTELQQVPDIQVEFPKLEISYKKRNK